MPFKNSPRDGILTSHSVRGRKCLMEILEEEFLPEDLYPDNDAVLKEAWPVPEEQFTREFEQYLLDIGVRI